MPWRHFSKSGSFKLPRKCLVYSSSSYFSRPPLLQLRNSSITCAKALPQTVVAYGTSLTAQPAAGQWVNDLRTWLNSEYPGLATVINSGMSGKASNTAVLNLQSKVLDYNPDTVIIEFSMNDAFTNFSASNNPTDWVPQITTARAKSNLRIDDHQHPGGEPLRGDRTHDDESSLQWSADQHRCDLSS